MPSARHLGDSEEIVDPDMSLDKFISSLALGLKRKYSYSREKTILSFRLAKRSVISHRGSPRIAPLIVPFHGSLILDHFKRNVRACQGQNCGAQHNEAKAEDERRVERALQFGARSFVDMGR